MGLFPRYSAFFINGVGIISDDFRMLLHSCVVRFYTHTRYSCQVILLSKDGGCKDASILKGIVSYTWCLHTYCSVSSYLVKVFFILTCENIFCCFYLYFEFLTTYLIGISFYLTTHNCEDSPGAIGKEKAKQAI